MSAGGGGGGGKRDVNVELNLVPYIDLLSTLICFLLLTAVWNQIAALSTNANNSTASEAPAPPPDPNRVDLSVSVFLDRTEMKAGTQAINLPHGTKGPDSEAILRTLESWKQKWPDRKDVTLNTDSQAQYDYLIKVMDTLVEGDFADIGVNTQ
ncbi:MAG: ExbD/TolR family protein [Pseudobdellovibrionaceae bacterium]